MASDSLDLENVPSVSIVIPSYNCGQYIEETIRSILLQFYPRLQLIVIDGGSTDDTLEILDYYSDYIDIAISEPDAGQADAINKGLSLCEGEYFNWVNADDLLAPMALSKLFEELTGNPDIIASSVADFSSDIATVARVVKNFGFSAKNFMLGPNQMISYHQPGVWIKKGLFNEVGFYRDDMRYVFDAEMMIRLLIKPRAIKYYDFVSIYFRLRTGSKTVSEFKLLQKEDHFMPIRIFDNSCLISLHQTQARKLLDHGWNQYISHVFQRKASISLLLEICSHWIKDPIHRLNRFSLGAFRFHLVNLLRSRRGS